MPKLNLVVLPKDPSAPVLGLKKVVDLPFTPYPDLAVTFPHVVPLLEQPITFWVEKDFLFYEVASEQFVAVTYDEDVAFDDWRSSGFTELIKADIGHMPSLRMTGLPSRGNAVHRSPRAR